MGLAGIIAGLALMVALGALWFVSDVMKRLDKQAEVIFEAHIKPVNEASKEHHKNILTLMKDVAELKKQLQAQAAKQGVSPEEVALLSQSVQTLSNKLDELDRQIPARYRVAPQKSSSNTHV